MMSEYQYQLLFIKCLYFNRYIYKVWILVLGLMLVQKVYTVDFLGNLTTYLAVTVYILLIILEAVRIVLGYVAAAGNSVPEMGGFLLLTNLMQLPLVSFFLFNPYLNNLPVETFLNGSLFILAIMEATYGYIQLKQASAEISEIYYAQFREKNSQVPARDK